jgi:hypothetical protein
VTTGDGLRIEQRDGAETDGRGGLRRRPERWFIVDAQGCVVAPGMAGYRHEIVAVEALAAMSRGAHA